MTTEEPTVENAIIEKARITRADRGTLSAWLHLKFNGAGQGFGGFTLYLPKDSTHHAGQANYAGHFIYRCLEIADVMDWEQLQGKTVRVRHTWSAILAIGHIVDDKWFDPREEFAALKAGLSAKVEG